MRDRHPPPSAVLASAAPAAVLAVVILLPFLTKAFTNDDVTFLLQARHVLADPLHPTAFEMVFHGVRLRLSHALVTGPVMAYLLIPALTLGHSELVAHGMQLILLVVCVCAVASIALRLDLERAHATVAALLLVISPAVLGMAATAMPDIPAMTFTAVGVERFLAWRDGRRYVLGLIAATFLALAILSRPHALLVLPCLSLWLVPAGRQGRPPVRLAATFLREVVRSPLAVTLVLTGIALFVTRDPVSGDTIAQATVRRVQPQLIAFNLVSMALHWALAFPFVLLWPLARRYGLLRSLITPVGVAGSFVLAGAAGFMAPRVWWYTVPLGLLAGVSAVVLCDVFVDGWRRRDRTQFTLGCWLLIPAVAAPYVQLPAKVLLVSAPAMAIVLTRRFAIAGGPLSRWTLGITALVGTTVGILVIRADADMAQIGRLGGRVVAEHVGQERSVWMDGAWGFQWYALQAGAQALAETPPFPRSGDFVVSGLRARLVRTGYPDRTLLSRRIFDGPGGRVYGEGAGFFNNRAGLLPWVWGTQEIGRIEVWRIDSPSIAGR